MTVGLLPSPTDEQAMLVDASDALAARALPDFAMMSPLSVSARGRVPGGRD